MSAHAQSGDKPYREYSTMVAREGLLRVPILAAHLPDRCVVCNGSAETVRVKIILYRPGRPDSTLALLILLCTNWIAFLYLRPVIVDFAMCVAHWRRRRGARAILGLAAALCFVLAIATMTVARTVGLLLFMAAAGFGVGAQLIYPVLRLKRVDQEYAWLRVSPSFLESFPTEITRAG